jgi:hypothetical protein
VCIDVLYGDFLSRRRFVEETFCMCAVDMPLSDSFTEKTFLLYGAKDLFPHQDDIANLIFLKF